MSHVPTFQQHGLSGTAMLNSTSHELQNGNRELASVWAVQVLRISFCQEAKGTYSF